MTGEKYLSELISPDDFRPGNLNLIQAPTGSGKTHFALETLLEGLPLRKHVLYLTDTVSNVDAILSNYDAADYDTHEEELRLREGFGERASTAITPCVVMTYAKLGTVLEYNPQFPDRFAVIICDELHHLIEYQSYDKKQPEAQKTSPRLKAVEEALKQIVRASTKTLVIGMTATPDRVYAAFGPYVRIHAVQYDEEAVRRYTTDKTIPTRNILISLYQEQGRGIVFATHIQTLQKMQQELAHRGKRCIALWSPQNQDNPLSEEQASVRMDLLKTGQFPDGYDILLINSSMETGVNIYGDISYMAIQSNEKEKKIQVRGRFRGDLPRLYLIDKDADLIIPEKYLNRRLFTKDKEELCEELNLRSENGTLLKWLTVYHRITEEGSSYAVELGRQSNKRYAIITRKEVPEAHE